MREIGVEVNAAAAQFRINKEIPENTRVPSGGKSLLIPHGSK
jgi:hypothetical protein